MNSKLTAIIKRTAGLKNNTLTKNTLWMFLGHGSRTFIQAFYFIFIARALGVEGFGAFVGVVALTAIFAPFSSLGMGNLLIKAVSRDRTMFKRYWGYSLIVTLISGTIFVGVVLAIAKLYFPASITLLLVVSIAIADLFFSRILDISGQAFQAFEQLGWTAQLQVYQSTARMIAAFGMYIFISKPTPDQWGVLYLISTFITAIIAFIIVNKKLGNPHFKLRFSVKEIKEGLYFSISLSSQGIYNDIDKSILTRMSTLEATGIYAAAYRIIDVVFTPIRSLLAASYAKFFQHGTSGIDGSLSFAKKLLPIGCGYGVFCGIMLYVCAPVVPYFLGSDYSNAVEAIKWMALIPFIRAIQYFAADLLTGAGYQGYRSLMQVVVAFMSVILNMLLIPLYSWKGAIWSGLCSNIILGLGLWVIVWYFHLRQVREGRIQAHVN